MGEGGKGMVLQQPGGAGMLAILAAWYWRRRTYFDGQGVNVQQPKGLGASPDDVGPKPTYTHNFVDKSQYMGDLDGGGDGLGTSHHRQLATPAVVEQLELAELHSQLQDVELAEARTMRLLGIELAMNMGGDDAASGSAHAHADKYIDWRGHSSLQA